MFTKVDRPAVLCSGWKKMLVNIYQTKRRHVPEDQSLNINGRDDLRSQFGYWRVSTTVAFLLLTNFPSGLCPAICAVSHESKLAHGDGLFDTEFPRTRHKWHPSTQRCRTLPHMMNCFYREQTLTPRSRVLLEKLILPQLVNKFPNFVLKCEVSLQCPKTTR
jgi:hypothetical protein